MAETGRNRPSMRELSYLLLLGLALTTGCNRQGEGERCDLRNYDLDCDQDEDLECIPLEGSTVRNAAVCCPRSGRTTNEACLGTDVSLDGGSTPPDMDAGSN